MFDNYKKTKRAILETTLQLLSKNDLQATSMALISSESGVSMGSIYNSFSGKEDIINELYRGIVVSQTAEVLQDFYQDSSIFDRFAMVWRKVIESSAHNPEAFLFMEQYSMSPYIYDSSKQEAYENNWCGPLSQMYAEAMDQQLFRQENPRLMVQLHWGTVVFLVKGHLQGNLALTPDVIDTAIRSCWNSISTAKAFLAQ